MILLPKSRPPTHPGELLEELIEELGLTQTELARRTGMPFPRVNEIIRGKRGVTSDTALRLARLFGTSPGMWLNYQAAWDLWHTARESAAEIKREVRPLPEAGTPGAAVGRRGGAGVSISLGDFRWAARSAPKASGFGSARSRRGDGRHAPAKRSRSSSRQRKRKAS